MPALAVGSCPLDCLTRQAPRFSPPSTSTTAVEEGRRQNYAQAAKDDDDAGGAKPDQLAVPREMFADGANRVDGSCY